MKETLALLALAVTPMLLAGERQSSPPAEPARQASSDAGRTSAARATSHDRHTRKHRSGSHHRRHRTTAKSPAQGR